MSFVAKGTIKSDRVSGEIEIHVRDNYYCPDIFVYHEEIGDWDEFNPPAGDPVFQAEVIRVLKAAGAISVGSNYEFGRAELGMQAPYQAAFETFLKDGIRFAEEFTKQHGGIRREKEPR